jgi:hypothetical protein
MIPQKDLPLMAKRFEKTVKNNFLKLAKKKKKTAHQCTIYFENLVEWPVRQKLYYFLDMQKIFFSKNLKKIFEGK